MSATSRLIVVFLPDIALDRHGAKTETLKILQSGFGSILPVHLRASVLRGRGIQLVDIRDRDVSARLGQFESDSAPDTSLRQ